MQCKAENIFLGGEVSGWMDGWMDDGWMVGWPGLTGQDSNRTERYITLHSDVVSCAIPRLFSGRESRSLASMVGRYGWLAEMFRVVLCCVVVWLHVALWRADAAITADGMEGARANDSQFHRGVMREFVYFSKSHQIVPFHIIPSRCRHMTCGRLPLCLNFGWYTAIYWVPLFGRA